MTKQVFVVDYGVGNLLNVVRAFERVGATVSLVSTVESIKDADRLVLPGVGAFGDGMRELREQGFYDALLNYVSVGRPLLGICLGMQMLFESSDEFGRDPGLALIEGSVKAIPSFNSMGASHKVPHIGWNEMEVPNMSTSWDSSLFDGIKPGAASYFVHSYMAMPKYDENRLANCDYNGIKVCAAVCKDNVFGCQFHPEKSGKVGLSVLSNFLRL
jgi:glutamine amidotransferase